MNLDQRIVKSKLTAAAEGFRLDAYLAKRFSYHTLEKWRELIADGRILLNDEPVPGDNILHCGDVLNYIPAVLEEPPVDLNYSVIYQDADILVINKSGDLPCHPAGPFFKHTLWHHASCVYGKIYLVNRLDRETSGLLLAARSPEVAGTLSRQLPHLEKEYRALVFGEFTGPVNAAGFLVQDAASAVRKKRRFVFPEQVPENAGKICAAETWFEPLWTKNGISMVRALLKTGRLHQIRASLFSLGFPLVGDKLYGPDDRIYLKIRENKISASDWQKLRMRRQALHSYRLSFVHPVSREILEFTAPLPPDFAF
ncbi:MAG: RluA family pseudouridine synthase [Victivallaceae bacterium]|nr:RluA family pseudouridine synthase [Victivallaceae bacterium]